MGLDLGVAAIKAGGIVGVHPALISEHFHRDAVEFDEGVE
jgi:hypothetical protein